MMTVHVLHAGNGYTYLTRQVAHGDVNRERGNNLASYYTAQGAPPGRWLGSGVAALGVTGHVEEKQMQALFGEGLHPEAEAIIQRELDGGATAAAAVREAKLGRAYPTFDTSHEESWRESLAERLGERAAEQGIEAKDASGELCAQVRREIGWEWFTADRGREPVDETELKTFISRMGKPTPQPVAGYDLVFTPVKSVSVLWGVSDHETRGTIEQAHQAAVARALNYLETEALYTRQGAAGVTQVDAQGLVATAFDHYDSRAGDPNFHTHVAVANKVQGPDGKWRSIDGRVLHAAGVSASERYNTALERELEQRLGVRFEERSTGRENKRPTREVVGVDEDLSAEFSQRRNAIEDRFDQLRGDYRAAHGHEPSKAVQHRLAQQATLDTRGAKEELESLEVKRERWLRRAAARVGDEQLAGLVDRCREAGAERNADREMDVEALAVAVVDRVSQDRSRWRVWHLRAEAERQVRGVSGLDAEQTEQLVEDVTRAAVDQVSLSLEAPDAAPVPVELQRADGESMFRVHGAGWHSSPVILAAEDRLLDATQMRVLPTVDAEILDAFFAVRDTSLDEGQHNLVRHFATSDRFLAVGVGPAGSGKTRAMREYVAAVTATGRRVVAVAPSAVAAQMLGDDIGAEATTIAKLLHTAHHRGNEATGLRAGDVLLVDEAGMASTRDLDTLTRLAAERGCVVRMVGDPAQLAAVEAGGAFRLLASRTDVVELDTLHRFHDPAEARATLAVRAGDPTAADFYEDHQRLHGGSRDALLDQIYAGWRADTEAGRSSLMLACDAETVQQLSTRARLDRVAAGDVEEQGVSLHDGSTAARGDVVVTRRNDRRLATAGGRDFVKNGDLWIIKDIEADGALQLQHKQRGGAVVRVPAAYAADHVELGYALTVHRAQGVTVDVTRSLGDDATSREAAYVAMSRARAENHFYAVTHTDVDVDLHHPTERDSTARQVFETVLSNDTADRSAHETITDAQEHADSLARLVPEYEHARGAAAAHQGTVDEALTAALGRDVVDQLREDPAWHALADRVAALPDEGRDPQAVLAAAAEASLDDAQSPAAVLTWRINQAAPRGGIEDWIGKPTVAVASPEPSGQRGGQQGDLKAWVDERRTQIQRRVDHLAASAIAEQPAWLPRTVGERPAPESKPAGAYEAAVRAAVTYRDRYQIRDVATPLGHEPTDGRQLRDWRRVHDLARTAQETGARPGVERVDLADRVRQLREKNQRLAEQRRDGQRQNDHQGEQALAQERERQELDRQAMQSHDDLEL